MKESSKASKVVYINRDPADDRTARRTAARILANDISRLARRIRESATSIRKSLEDNPAPSLTPRTGRNGNSAM